MSVRVVLLEKIASLKQGCFEVPMKLPRGALGPWVTLGHFDAMHTYELDTAQEGMFRTINKDNIRVAGLNSVEAYFHPLYLIADEDDSAFWEEQTWYFAIARIHFSQSVDVAGMREWLKEKLGQDEQGKRCEYRTYQTIELSDMILALKANNIKDMLTFVLSLRKYSCIGKVYTYFGVDYSYIKEPEREPEMDADDVVPMFSMRFSVADLQQVDEVFAGIEGALGRVEEYSVVGVDDIVVSWTSLPTSRLVELYRRWFISTDRETALKHPDTAFLDVTTRVGIALDRNPVMISYDCGHDSNIKLKYACEELIKMNGEIQDLAHEYLREDRYETLHRWLKSMSELTKALMRMSRTAVMDEFVYLMLPGVRSFLRNVKEQLTEKRATLESDIGKYHKFVEYWTHLMEHIMRLEGQLTHRPEIRPIIYDMPITMLEYTLAFLVQCANVLQTKDDPKMEIDFLLVPQLCERIAANELFPAQKDMPGLVLVSIPLHMLYDPMTVQSALCHETSHFVGETYRNRKSRVQYFTAAVAALMAKTVFQCYNPGLIMTIRDDLRAVLRNRQRNSIKELAAEVLDWAEKLLSNREKYSEFIRDVLCCNQQLVSGSIQISPDMVWEAQKPMEIRTNMDELKNSLVSAFGPLLSDLTTLFRETYADLCMMHLLQMDPVTYVKTMHEEFTLGDENKRYEQFAIRVYVCLQASELEIPGRDMIGQSEEMDGFFQKLEQLEMNMTSEEENTQRLFPIASIIQLQEYTKECYRDLVHSLCNSTQLNELRAMFSQVTSRELRYDKLEESINTYRKKVIGANPAD